MPSDPGALPVAAGSRRWDWLWSQGLGVLCGQATVALLAVGSVVLAATREGASAGIAMDDLRGFFAAPSIAHLWFYLLVPVLLLYALNTALATWQNATRKWRSGIRSPQPYAPAIIHVAFLTGLLAHAVGGLGGGDLGRVMVGPGWSALGDGREARVTALDVETHSDGSTKQVRASVEVRTSDGAVATEVVRYNGPLSRGLGSDLLLLIRPQGVPAVQLARGGERCDVAVEASCDLGGVRAEVLYVHPPRRAGAAGRAGHGAMARVRVQGPARGPAETFWLTQGQAQRLADGSSLAIAGIAMRPALLLHRRHAPGNPWALLASVLLALGLALMWRRFLPGAGRPPA